MDQLNFDRLVAHVRRTAEAAKMWSPEDTVVVAVSGGPDSVALLHVLHQIALSEDCPLQLIVAHVNHGFRPEESREEAEFVRELAAQLSWPFELAEVDVPAYMKQTGMGGQEAAREMRYTFLHQVADLYGAHSIALAHHGDDQAETVLLRLLRGSGLTGLAGMKLKRREKNVELVRPFLRIYKTDLIRICHESGFTYITDSSNLTNKYVRNSIRLDVLPFLGQYNGQLTESLNRLSVVAGDEDDYMQLAAEDAFKRLAFTRSDGGIVLDIKPFVQLHVALQRRLIKLILTYLPLNKEESDFTKIEALRLRAQQEQPTTWRLDLGGGSLCRREYHQLVFLPQEEEGKPFQFCLETLPAKVAIPGTGKVLEVTRQTEFNHAVSLMPHNQHEALFDADELIFPLTVRSRQPGDAMRIMGLNGSKKVKDIFIDEKIPPSLRSRCPLVTDAAGRILWIPGIRRSSHALVGPGSSAVISVKWNEEEGEAAGLSVGSGFHSIT
ncbi:tRNA lysidine(34) synthetase TilS [Paenibacillus sp. CAA11]|uniref:tRNA lysidine(34) synthetase TilS n=1 Tax=Paenibacillus sp. CAA11 TaxID=1532905 RepID=UPI000D3D6B5F|nr:tRNA lysidine(34) synthetase TilS [Paenibacillus sp. CAA11]AWB42828.1 tRNA lysidine(34) synthetase TilS [Paenibacillus sp. CAA11]